MAVNGENRWPQMGRNRWPLTKRIGPLATMSMEFSLA